ncbi:Neurofilament medium polypeptide [Liparis tanakae]|uniref:Neurofilament medium polypeptide n=1 Tax=Liparis tanakae TaxID=230148 RepID=A0A4Z2DZZ0_9TELE|nr:Neurofilament medium polypeptide [Liparis tanakae]
MTVRTLVDNLIHARPEACFPPSVPEPLTEEPLWFRTPLVQNPSQKNPSQKNPSQKNPSQKNPSQKNPSQKNPSQKNPSQKNPSQKNPSQKNPSAPRRSLPAVLYFLSFSECRSASALWLWCSRLALSCRMGASAWWESVWACEYEPSGAYGSAR